MVIVEIMSRKTGNPLSGKRIAISNDSIFSGFVSKGQLTNSKGQVQFDKVKPCPKGKIFLDGNTAYEGKIEAVNRIYV